MIYDSFGVFQEQLQKKYKELQRVEGKTEKC